jgi:hypothetical protein
MNNDEENLGFNRLFITGIPTAGKSYLAKSHAEKYNGIHVDLDKERKNLLNIPECKEWVNFYLNKNEIEYFNTTTKEERWNNLVKQSESFLPHCLKIIDSYKTEDKFVVFECVNLLPELVHNKISFPGIVLVGNSYEDVLKRLIDVPRWGKTQELFEIEARYFFFEEGLKYRETAEKYGYKVFKNSADAFDFLLFSKSKNLV